MARDESGIGWDEWMKLQDANLNATKYFVKGILVVEKAGRKYRKYQGTT